MDSNLLSELERKFKKCSDCSLDSDYITLLNKLCNIKLSQELVDYLCEKAISRNHIWEIRFDHLRILLLNPSANEFDLKKFYFENQKKSRRLAMKLFYIRGFASYASEEELNPVMEKFRKNLENNHDYIDYNYILSAAGLPYLVNTYGYNCFKQTLQKAMDEHQQIDLLLRGYFTLNENLEQINLLYLEECRRRLEAFLAKKNKADWIFP